MPRALRLAVVTAVTAVAAAIAAPAHAATGDVPPPGANDWSCRVSAAHPYPVVLVPGTFESMAKNWATMSPYLKQHGYCVFSLNYGTTNGVPATGYIERSAKELSAFVNRVLSATRTRQVDLVGHSQGGMMPRQYLKFLGGTAKVHALIGIAPSNHGTQGLIVPNPTGDPSLAPYSSAPNPACQACSEQQAGSPFLKRLNAGGDIQGHVLYTVISTTHDEVVTPYTSQALAGPARQVTNTVIQSLCPLDPIEHDQTPNDPVVQQLVLAALNTNTGPLPKSYRPSCV
jgi:triacylglycerol lipase